METEHSRTLYSILFSVATSTEAWSSFFYCFDILFGGKRETAHFRTFVVQIQGKQYPLVYLSHQQLLVVSYQPKRAVSYSNPEINAIKQANHSITGIVQCAALESTPLQNSWEGDRLQGWSHGLQAKTAASGTNHAGEKMETESGRRHGS